MACCRVALGLTIAAAAAASGAAFKAPIPRVLEAAASAAPVGQSRQSTLKPNVNRLHVQLHLAGSAATDGEDPLSTGDEESWQNGLLTRRQCLAMAMSGMGLVAAAAGAVARVAPKVPPRARLPDGDTQGSDYMELGGGSKSFAKPRIRYSDFETLKSGVQYKDAKVGTGKSAAEGDKVVMDWEGYTIGYNGGVFETTKGPKGGAYDEDKMSTRFVLGQGTVIPGLEQGILGMRTGGIRQIIVPPEMGYPDGDRKHELVGPKPSTFSGYRTLDFVLSNPGYIDKTLLFTIRLVRVDKPGDRGSRAERSSRDRGK